MNPYQTRYRFILFVVYVNLVHKQASEQTNFIVNGGKKVNLRYVFGIVFCRNLALR